MADYEATKIDKANHLLLDQPLLRLPYELLRKNFRSAHFIVEKESVAVKNSLKETATAGLKGTQSPDDILKNLDAMINRMRGVKRKLQGYADEEAKIYTQVEARTEHLAELAGMYSLNDVAYETWSRRRLDRLLVDYLLRHGYGSSASEFVSNDPTGKLRDLVDIDIFESMSQIRQSLLRDHSVTEALAWCVDNKKELRKMDSQLEFMLRFQQFIELVRAQDLTRVADTIAHARKYLTPMHSTFPKECSQAAILMCFSIDTAPAAYAELFNTDRWTMLADLFTTTHNQLLSLPTAPLLHLALSSGLSALKTPACHATKAYSVATNNTNGSTAANGADGANGANGTNGADEADGDAANFDLHDHILDPVGSSVLDNDTSKPMPPPPASLAMSTARVAASVCPICSLELNELARHVPYAHHSKSHVENDLMLLPNGRVYSKAQLDDHARKANFDPGWIKDLRTGDVYPINQLKKVYIT